MEPVAEHPLQNHDGGDHSLGPTSPTVASPLLSPSSRQTTFQGAERPWLLAPSRCSSPELGPYSIAEAERPPRSPYARSFSDTSSVSSRFSLLPDPSSWGTANDPESSEPDDALHMPDPMRDKTIDMGGTICTFRGVINLGCLFILLTGVFTLFAGFPIASHFIQRHQLAVNAAHTAQTAQAKPNKTMAIPLLPGSLSLIDADTPEDAKTRESYIDGSAMELVFSDEFNVDGRTFYPGDDPYWEAVDLHYWQTGNLEWYDPAAITTKGGALEITLSNMSTHGLYYQGGMMTTWNKFCFTGGILEASVTLPGPNNIHGLWPAVWAMGNLGRAGYGASLEGMWPYTYDACDVGTLANQTLNGLPKAALENGDPGYDGVLSYLPGQRLSRCTCPGESHPGPIHADGTYVGRSAPEIDVFEATISYTTPAQGQVSQSGQWAPFNAEYIWLNTSANLIIPNKKQTALNEYAGGVYQQTTSALTTTNQDCYEETEGCFSVFGFEYKPGFEDAYIGWITDDKLAWQQNSAGLGADTLTEISARPVPQEPLYILLNLGISENFGWVDYDHLTFPTTMRIDYVRVYQRPDAKNVGCDPPDFPTSAYINQYIEAYTNPNLTTWKDDYGQPFPKNNLIDEC